MKNNKGFTITELLVIVAIMLTILGIAVYGYAKISEKQKLEARKQVFQQVEHAAEQYFSTNEYLKNDITDDKYAYVSVGTLVENDFLAVVTDPVTEKQLDNCMIVRVSKVGGVLEYKLLASEQEQEEIKQILGTSSNEAKTCKYEPIIVDPKLTKLTLNIYKSGKGCSKGELLNSKLFIGPTDPYQNKWDIAGWYNLTNAPYGLVVEFVTSDESGVTYSLNNSEEKTLKNKERICITDDKKGITINTKYGNDITSNTTLNLDKTKPTIKVAGNKEGWINNIGDITWTMTDETSLLKEVTSYENLPGLTEKKASSDVLDNEKGKYSLGGSKESKGNINLNTYVMTKNYIEKIEDGVRKHTKIVCDNAGNCAQKEVVTKLDAVSPTVAIKSYEGSDNVIRGLDTTAKVDNAINSKTVTLLGNNWTNKMVVVRSSAADNLSGISKLECIDPRDNSIFKDFRRIMDVTEGALDFKCVAYDLAGNNSADNKVVVNRDMTPPTLTVSAYGSTTEAGAVNKTSKLGYTSNTWYKGWAWVNAEAVDESSNVKLYYVRKKGSLGGSSEKNMVIDGGLTVTHSDYSAKEGISIYNYYACDAANNCSPAKGPTIKLDRTAPTTPKVALIDGGWNEVSNDTWYNKDIYVSGQAKSIDPNPTASDTYSGISYYQISTDNKNWATWAYDYTSSTYKINWDGTTYRYVRAVDKVGNVSDVTTKIIKRDIVAPSCGSFTGEGSESNWINKTTSLQTRTITASCYDSVSGCVSNPIQSYTADAKTAAFNQTIKDKAGNTASCSAIVGVYIDKTEPTCDTPTGQGSESNWINSYSVNKTRTVTAACSDATSGCGTLPSQLYSTDAKTAAFNKTIKDKAGNSKTCSYTVGVYRDVTPPPSPTVALVNNKWVEVSNNTWYNTNIYISGKANSDDPNPISNDNVSGTSYYQISTDNSNWTTWAYDYTSTTYKINWDGTTYRYVRAVDNAGNVSDVTTKTIKRDTTAPTLTVKAYKSNTKAPVVEYSTNLEEYTYGTWYSGWAWVSAIAKDTLNSTTLYYKRTPDSIYGGSKALDSNVTSGANQDAVTANYSDAQGISNYSYYACDALNNCTSIKKMQIRLDRTAPTCEGISGMTLCPNADCEEGKKDKYYKHIITFKDNKSGIKTVKDNNDKDKDVYYNHCYDNPITGQDLLICSDGFKSGEKNEKVVKYTKYELKNATNNTNLNPSSLEINLTQYYGHDILNGYYHLFYWVEDKADNKVYCRYKLNFDAYENKSSIIHVGTITEEAE